MPKIEVRIDTGGDDHIPHAFLVLTDSNGVSVGYGFAPAKHLNLWGAGKVSDDTIHEYDPDKSWSYDITEDSFPFRPAY